MPKSAKKQPSPTSSRSSGKSNREQVRKRRPAPARATFTNPEHQEATEVATREESDHSEALELIKQIHRGGYQPIDDVPAKLPPENQKSISTEDLDSAEPWVKILEGDSQARKAYQDFLLSDVTLADRQFAERALSDDNLERLGVAKDKAVPPDAIMLLCYEFAPRRGSQSRPLTQSEARTASRRLRRMAKFLRALLPRLVLPVALPSQSAQNEAGRGQYEFQMLPRTAPEFQVLTRQPLLFPPSMKQLWDVAGRDAQTGILLDLALSLKSIAPSLAVPRRRPAHQAKNLFAWAWGKLFHDTLGSSSDELGAWFIALTFGSSEYDAEAFAKLRRRAFSKKIRRSRR